MLWDLSREDDVLVASSGIDDDSHQEPVTTAGINVSDLFPR